MSKLLKAASLGFTFFAGYTEGKLNQRAEFERYSNDSRASYEAHVQSGLATLTAIPASATVAAATKYATCPPMRLLPHVPLYFAAKEMGRIEENVSYAQRYNRKF